MCVDTKCMHIGQNIWDYKTKFMKIIICSIVGGLLAAYLVSNVFRHDEYFRNVAYDTDHLWQTPYTYGFYMFARIAFTYMMSVWLSINGLFDKPVPKDSMGYVLYTHCSCCSAFICQCLCCCVDTNVLFDQDTHTVNTSNPPPKVAVEMVEIGNNKIDKMIPPSIKTVLEEKRSNDSQIQSPSQHQTQSVDEYADIDDMTVNYTTKPQHHNQPTITINVTQTNDMHKMRSLETYTANVKPYHLHHKMNSSKTLSTETPITCADNDEFSALPTYESRVHGATKGILDAETPDFAKNISLSPSNYRFPSITGVPTRKKGDNTSVFIMEQSVNLFQKNISNDSALIESDSDGIKEEEEDAAENEMILGIKCVVYSFEVLMENINSVDDNTKIASLEAKIIRLSQHFNTMDDNIAHVVVMSDRLKTNEMKNKFKILQLKQLLNAENIIGVDHELMSDCNQSLKMMVRRLMAKLKLHKHELLFVGTGVMMGVCEIYDSNNGTLKGKHFTFLESQVLASV